VNQDDYAKHRQTVGNNQASIDQQLLSQPFDDQVPSGARTIPLVTPRDVDDYEALQDEAFAHSSLSR
jgi:hypothetical protein